MKNEIYEKHIQDIEGENTVLREEIKQLQGQIETIEKRFLVQKGELLRRTVLFLNATYGQLGAIQAGLLKELNNLNDANMVVTNERIREALTLVNQLLPLNATDDDER